MAEFGGNEGPEVEVGRVVWGGWGGEARQTMVDKEVWSKGKGETRGYGDSKP